MYAETNATMTIEEAAKLLGVGRNQAYAAAARGEIPVIKLGRRYLVLRLPLEQMLRGELCAKRA